MTITRGLYFDFCENQLSLLCVRIELRAGLNLLDLNIHSEDFYVDLLNLMYGYSLKNINAINQNAEGIDLVDLTTGLVVQVSSTATKKKVESALQKDLSAYKNYTFKFVSISKDASNLRKGSYKNPHNLLFDPVVDIYDVKSLLKKIQHSDIVYQRKIYDFLRAEIFQETKPLTESNLAAIIKILASEDLSSAPLPIEPIPFKADEKISFNNLKTTSVIIEDYKIHYGRINKIYATFDSAGKNKSKSVLDFFRKSYVLLSEKYQGDELFLRVVEAATEKVISSSNHEEMALEELDMCITILAVDAFIRCRIFKRPEGLLDVAA